MPSKNEPFRLFFSLPEWALEVLRTSSKVFDDLAVAQFTGYIRSNETLKAKTGFLVEEIFDRFKNKTLSLLNPDYSFWMYFAHDNAIINVLSALQVYKVIFFPYFFRFKLFI